MGDLIFNNSRRIEISTEISYNFNSNRALAHLKIRRYIMDCLLSQVLGTVRTRNHVVFSELTMLVNASDNNAHVRCEATNSATEIPLLKVLVLKVNCKMLHSISGNPLLAVLS